MRAHSLIRRSSNLELKELEENKENRLVVGAMKAWIADQLVVIKSDGTKIVRKSKDQKTNQAGKYMLECMPDEGMIMLNGWKT